MGRRTPPAWDPLGAAPFAWDLPEPGPDPAQPTESASAAGDLLLGRSRGGVIGRVFLGLALLTGGSLAAGMLAGLWSLPWAAVAGLTVGVIGIGLVLASLRGRRGRVLIGPGIFLALVTMALTVTGISGTTGYGQHTWTPTAGDIQSSYVWNAGQVTLDFSHYRFDPATPVTTSLSLGAGQATVIVPNGVTVDATCSARVGDVRCAGTDRSGRQPTVTTVWPGGIPAAPTPPEPPSAAPSTARQAGMLTIHVHVNAGQAEVRTNG